MAGDERQARGAQHAARGPDRAARPRRALRLVLFALAIPLALLLTAALLISLRPVREALLREAVARADQALPGAFRGTLSWPELGSIEAEDLLWTAGGDTLLAIPRAGVRLRLAGLLQRDLHLIDLHARVRAADLAAIGELLPPATDAPGADDRPRRGFFPLRAGAFPRVPSLAIDRLEISWERLAWQAGGAPLSGELRARCDLRPHTAGLIDLQHLCLEDSAAVQAHLSATLDLDRAHFHIAGSGTLPGGWWYEADAGPAGDGFGIRLQGGRAAAVTAGSTATGTGAGPAGGPRQPWVAAELDGSWRREEQRVTGAALQGVMRILPASISEIDHEGRGGVLPPFVLQARAAGFWHESPHASLWIDADPNEILRGGALALRVDPAAFALDTLWLAGDGIRLSAAATRKQTDQGGPALDGRLDLAADGVAWLEPWLAPEQRPDSLHLRARVTAQGAAEAPALTLDLQARGSAHGQRLDDLSLIAAFPAGPSDWGRVALIAQAYEARLTAAAELRAGEEIQIRLAPLEIAWIRPAAEQAARPVYQEPDPATWARARIAPREGQAAIERLLVTGLLGDLRADATVPLPGAGVAATEASSGIRTQIEISWSAGALPPLLDAVMPDSAAMAHLASAWAADGPFRATARIEDTPSDPNLLTGRVRFHLPGPRTWLPLWFPEADVGDLGAIDGSGRFDHTAAEDGSTGQALLDWSETAWLEEGTLAARWGRREVWLERARIRGLGIDLSAQGGRMQGAYDAAAQLTLDPRDLFARLGRPELIRADSVISVDLGVTGAQEAPRLSLQVDGPLTAGGVTIPGLDIAAQASQGRWDLRARTAATHLATGFHADSILFCAHTLGEESGALLPASLALTLESPALGIGAAADLNVGDSAGTTLTIRELAARWDQKQLHLTAPCQMRIDPGSAGFELTPLVMEGTLGRLSARADWSARQRFAQIGGALELPAAPVSAAIDPELWPERLRFTLSLPDTTHLSGTLAADGLALFGHGPASVQIEVRAGPGGGGPGGGGPGGGGDPGAGPGAGGDPGPGAGPGDEVTEGRSPAQAAGSPTLSARLVLAAAQRELLTGALELPLAMSWNPPGAGLAPGALSGHIAWTELPLPAQSVFASEEEILLLSGGRIDLHGPPESIAVGLQATVRAPDYPPLREDRVELHVLMRPAARAGAAVDTSGTVYPLVESLAAELPAALRAGLIAGTEETWATARWMRGPRRLLRAHARAPVRLVWNDSLYVMQTSEPLLLQVASDTLDLREVNALLPGGLSLRGRLHMNLQADGPIDRFDLSGDLMLRDLQVETVDGTRAGGQAQLALSGTRAAPVMRGTVRVGRGQIRVPDPPRRLHPVAGEARLWSMPAAAADSAPAGAREEPETADAGAAAAARLPLFDTDIAVEIPGGLWIRGRGLNVELAGDLKVLSQGKELVLNGSLSAVGGHLIFLGRTFFVQRGEAYFYGNNDTDPALDILLNTRIDGTLVNVQITGYAWDPRLNLTADPEMTEGDIVSFLLFGRTLDELDHDQMSLVQRRATEVAASYGAAQLGARLAEQFGVDMLTIQGRQLLDARASFLVNLEYFFSRHFKLSTHYGQGEQSGVEINWATEY